MSRLSAGSETRVQRDFCACSFKPVSYLNGVNLTHTTSERAIRINLDFATPITGLGRLVCQYLHFRSHNYVHGDACVNMSCPVDPSAGGDLSCGHLQLGPIMSINDWRKHIVNKAS